MIFKVMRVRDENGLIGIKAVCLDSAGKVLSIEPFVVTGKSTNELMASIDLQIAALSDKVINASDLKVSQRWDCY